MSEHDDQTAPHSGSRWEPQPGGSTGETVAAPVRPARPGRRRAAIAGAAVALFAAGGVGGFAIGSEAGNDDAPQTGVVQDPDGDGFHGGPRDGGRPGPPAGQGDDGTTDDGDGTT